MKRIGEGRTAEIFEYGDDKVLKLYRTGFPKDAIIYELEINNLISSLGIPAPEAYEQMESGDRLGIIFRYIEGEPLMQKIARNPLQLKHFTEMLAEMHYHIHKHEINTDSGWYVRKQKEVLTQNIQQASRLSIDERNTVVRYLERLPDGDHLCHGDFHPQNALVGERRWAIDWMTGMIGDPAGDAARTLLLFRFGTLPEDTPAGIKEALLLMKDEMGDAYINHYISCSGLAFEDIDRWTLPVAAARLTEWIPDEEKDALISLIRQRLEQPIIIERG